MAKVTEQVGGPPHPDLAATEQQRDDVCRITAEIIVGEVGVPLPARREGAMFADDEGRRSEDARLDSTRKCLLAIESTRDGRSSTEYLRDTAYQTDSINQLGESACRIYCPIARSFGYCPIAKGVIKEIDSKLIRVATKGRVLPLRDEDLVKLLDGADDRSAELADRVYKGFTSMAIRSNPVNPTSHPNGQLLMYDAEELFEGFLKGQLVRFEELPRVKRMLFEQYRLEL